MILVLNCGSQSIKWKIFDENLKLVKENKIEVLNAKNYEKLLKEQAKIIGRYDLPITVVGHRVVHGGSMFRRPTKITGRVLKNIEKLNHLAPLHNPYNVLGIKIFREVFKNIPQVAVFDAEFFGNLPQVAYTYALPEKFGFRRYGFHGISHEYVAKEAAKKLGKQLNNLKVITCHLGGGSSITAIKNGKAIDTSMGFTPMEGLVMMTRPGNIDAGIVLELAKRFGAKQADEILNKQSGVRGICGESEMLNVLQKIKSGPPAGRKKAKLALDVFVYSTQKYIGSYFAILGGLDVLVFTGTIGSGSAKIRGMICKNLEILKGVKVLALQTDEELAIAQKLLSIK